MKTRKEMLRMLVLLESSGTVHHVLFPQHCVEHAQFLDCISSSCVICCCCLIQLETPAAFWCLLFSSCSFLSFVPLMQQSAKVPFGAPQFVVLLKTFEVEVRAGKNILVRKTYTHVLHKGNVPVVFGCLPFGIEPKATLRSYSILLLFAAVNQIW